MEPRVSNLSSLFQKLERVSKTSITYFGRFICEYRDWPTSKVDNIMIRTSIESKQCSESPSERVATNEQSIENPSSVVIGVLCEYQSPQRNNMEEAAST